MEGSREGKEMEDGGMEQTVRQKRIKGRVHEKSKNYSRL